VRGAMAGRCASRVVARGARILRRFLPGPAHVSRILERVRGAFKAAAWTCTDSGVRVGTKQKALPMEVIG
jgi:hypothetical protein